MNILIAYASRYGSTAEISEKISETLENEGFSTTLIDLKKKSSKKNMNIQDYDGILIGTGIKIGAWTKEAKKFLQDNIEVLKQKQNTLGVYVSSGEGVNPDKCIEAKEKYIDKIMQQNALSPVMSEAFGGVFDLTENSNLGFMGKKMIKMVSKNDPNIKPDVKNDFRNWEQILGFAKKYAGILKK